MSNTTIQILRSYVNASPNILSDGEMAYSFVSNTLFIGNQSNNVIKIGGPGFLANIGNLLISVDGGTF